MWLPWLPYLGWCVLLGLLGIVSRAPRMKALALVIAIVTFLTWTPISHVLPPGPTVHGWWWAHSFWVPQPFQAIDLSFWFNIAMTVPIGWLLASIKPRTSGWSWVLIGLSIGLALEGGQVVLNAWVHLGRWIETDDVVTNAFGVWLGAGVWTWWEQGRLK